MRIQCRAYACLYALTLGLALGSLPAGAQRAGEFDKSVPPLTRAAELATTGDLFVRLGEVQVQREDWAAAQSALERGLSKGSLRDRGYAQLYMGIVLLEQEKPCEAREWFVRARGIERHRRQAEGYIQYIDSQVSRCR